MIYLIFFAKIYHMTSLVFYNTLSYISPWSLLESKYKILCFLFLILEFKILHNMFCHLKQP